MDQQDHKHHLWKSEVVMDQKDQKDHKTSSMKDWLL